MNRDIGIEIAANPELLSAVRGLVRSYVGSFGFNKDKIDEVVLAIDEACANSIRHAYGGPCNSCYSLSMSSSNGWIEFELSDNGQPAPKERIQLKSTDGPLSLDAITPGGLGLQFIYGVFDNVEFIPGATQGNRVTMKLKRPFEVG